MLLDDDTRACLFAISIILLIWRHHENLILTCDRFGLRLLDRQCGLKVFRSQSTFGSHFRSIAQLLVAVSKLSTHFIELARTMIIVGAAKAYFFVFKV